MDSQHKKRVLVIDLWRCASTGAGKQALYTELSECFDLLFLHIRIPRWFTLFPYVRSFHPSIRQWKERKRRLGETVYKYPSTFSLLTRLHNQALVKQGLSYDAIVQIGSLFGPVHNPRGVAYYSYSDSTVRNVEQMCPEWMPDDFERHRRVWYSLEKRYFEQVTGSMFYSRWAADTVVSEYGIERNKTHVVGSALKLPNEYVIDWSGRSKHVVFVTTDFDLKGGHELLKIMKRVVAHEPDAVLTIVGNVPKPVRKCQYPWLKLAGVRRRSEIVNIYKQSSVLVLPARYDAFPSVVLEAANLEVPAVASSICGIPEMIIDGQTGFLVSPEKHELFAQRIIAVLKDRQMNMAMGKAAKRLVRERFHPSAVARNIVNVLGR